MAECIFCKIASGEIKTNFVYEDDEVLAFHDLKPQAPVHVIIIPTKHIPRISDIEEKNKALVGKLVVTANKIAREKNIDSSGFRLVMNCNEDAGQEVFHIHLHLLGGRQFKWPPG